ncbi:hypothetical protein [Mucilaginibacter lappiensis]|uniref:Bacteriocin-type signal sequence-containing protein n=1 Tax=Mucilaginibacter lappiensis TaxID=354630 RepID=A0A1N7CV59_9SPHI|nr:hypothetical protein [Mucilaginibacter lappiensis]MBB6111023.1 hypothetical protein [Mucilaginibacter lappiensis]MBB6128851.1 hypothetical protein [Mucilaginibacter lappiensis]SIR67459.1 hypothetical protein SAMN05421821_11041 [Mucilaginibacter lappiensis]
MNKIDGMIELDNIELTNISGGTVPSKDTSFANDIAYYIGYAGHGIWDAGRAFFGGASEGASGRFGG